MINVSGLIGIILFYLIIVLIGVWASRKQKSGNNAEEEIMLAGRNIGLFVGIFTMTGGQFSKIVIPIKIKFTIG